MAGEEGHTYFKKKNGLMKLMEKEGAEMLNGISVSISKRSTPECWLAVRLPKQQSRCNALSSRPCQSHYYCSANNIRVKDTCAVRDSSNSLTANTISTP